MDLKRVNRTMEARNLIPYFRRAKTRIKKGNLKSSSKEQERGSIKFMFGVYRMSIVSIPSLYLDKEDLEVLGVLPRINKKKRIEIDQSNETELEEEFEERRRKRKKKEPRRQESNLRQNLIATPSPIIRRRQTQSPLHISALLGLSARKRARMLRRELGSIKVDSRFRGIGFIPTQWCDFVILLLSSNDQAMRASKIWFLKANKENERIDDTSKKTKALEYLLFRGTATAMDTRNNYIAVAGSDHSNQNGGRVTVWSITYTQSQSQSNGHLNSNGGISFQLKAKEVAQLTISSPVTSISLSADGQYCVFMTNTAHLCVWVFKTHRSSVFCAHHLNALSATLGINQVYFSSPGELNVMQIERVMDDNMANHNNHQNTSHIMMAMMQNIGFRKTTTLFKDANDHHHHHHHHHHQGMTKKEWCKWSQKRTILKSIKTTTTTAKNGIKTDLIAFSILKSAAIQLFHFGLTSSSSSSSSSCHQNTPSKWKKTSPIPTPLWEGLDPLYHQMHPKPQPPCALQCWISLPLPATHHILALHLNAKCRLIFAFSSNASLWIFSFGATFIRTLQIFDAKSHFCSLIHPKSDVEIVSTDSALFVLLNKLYIFKLSFQVLI